MKLRSLARLPVESVSSSLPSFLSRKRKKGGLETHPSVCELYSLNVFALLIGDGAGRFAGGLARSLALAAAAFGRTVLQRGAVQRLDMLHGEIPPLL